MAPHPNLIITRVSNDITALQIKFGAVLQMWNHELDSRLWLGDEQYTQARYFSAQCFKYGKQSAAHSVRRQAKPKMVITERWWMEHEWQWTGGWMDKWYMIQSSVVNREAESLFGSQEGSWPGTSAERCEARTSRRRSHRWVMLKWFRIYSK